MYSYIKFIIRYEDDWGNTFQFVDFVSGARPGTQNRLKVPDLEELPA